MSLRLNTISSLVPRDSSVINVGTDHALLEVSLAREKNVSSLAIDISPLCVKKAIKNVEKNNFLDKIKVILNDGLSNIDVKNNIIILSGLGTKTILRILKNIYDNDLIIQSNNDLEILRKNIINKGYYIYKEICLFENKWYSIIYFKKGHKKYKKIDYYLGISNNIDYYKYILKIKQKELKNIPNKYFVRKIKKMFLIKSINKKIKKI